MKTKVVIYVTVAVVTAIFFIANWALLSSPVPVNLLFARVETPLAMLLLICAGVVLIVDFAVHALAERAWRLDRQQFAAKVDAARRREEEVSRTQDLRASMEREFAAIRAQMERVVTGVQRLENDTMDIGPLDIAALAPRKLEPELIPPR